ncbi:unnamed protein product [Porites lobata]|uniref:Uncharacterized protein n=1 Tax=Porites lobata TaxID=104759 RepID=A0ABN8SGK6_9CNID|nr:unnamed protein product [Porites lobata]
MERLVDHYKGALMENSRLNHAARLAAKQHVLLASPNIPPATKKIRVKALGPAVRRATRRVRTMALPGAGGAAAGADDDGDEFAQGPMETFLKTLIKKQHAPPKATPKGKPKTPPTPHVAPWPPPPPHGRSGVGRAKMVGQDRHRISLARVPIHGARYPFGDTPEARGSRHQPIGPHFQTTRH